MSRGIQNSPIEDPPTKSAQVTFFGKQSYTVEHVLETFLNMLSKNLAWNKCLKVKSAHPHSAYPVFHMQIKNFNSCILETGNL